MKIRVYVTISGRVQGVFFRAYTKQRADRLGVRGWVRNLPSGGVEAIFEGEEDAVKKLVEYCRHGPPRAVVTSLSVISGSFQGAFESFTVK